MMPNIRLSNEVACEISATILYQLLQNVSQDNNGQFILSAPIKSEELPSSTSDFNCVSPAISVGIEESSLSHTNHMSSFSSTSSKNDSNVWAKYCNLTPNESVKLNPKKRLLQRHLLENGCEENPYISDRDSDSAYPSTFSKNAPFGCGKNGKPLTRTPFIPSYMDPKSGPFLCKVCGYKASGLHYRVMACEGCKGFFRRSVQKKLQYTCKMNNNCKIMSNNRTKCQECRWKLCLKAGMNMDSVLNEEERQVKNNLIKANRQKRKQDPSSSEIRRLDDNVSRSSFDSADIREKCKSNEELKLITEAIHVVTVAFDNAFMKEQPVQEISPLNPPFHAGKAFTNRVTLFAKMLPGISELSASDQNSLLQRRCLNIICLCTAFTFDCEYQKLTLPSGRVIDGNFIDEYKHLEPLWSFSRRVAEYQLSRTEMAVLTGLSLLVNNTLSSMDGFYNQLLVALDHLMTGQSLRTSKLLIVVFSDLQVLTSRLFELRAPLGQHLLFDQHLKKPLKVEEVTARRQSQHSNIEPLNTVIGGHRSMDDRQHRQSSINATSNISSYHPLSSTVATTLSSSSIYAFSYEDHQL